MSGKKLCIECFREFEQEKNELICSPKCKEIRLKRQKADQVKKISNARPPRDPIKCPYCKEMFVPRRIGHVVCDKKKCKLKRRRETVSGRKVTNKKMAVVRKSQGKDEYESILKPKYDFSKFTYTALYKRCVREINRKQDKKHAKDDRVAKVTRYLAMELLQERLDKLDPELEKTKLIFLERDYIREFEKKRLRMNIQKTFGREDIDGDYTLNEAGEVLGVSRERARQLEFDAKNVLGRPKIARVLRDYLDFDISDVEYRL